ncbi:MAG: hypothetical protein Q4C98_05235 [Capnocytophaga sp.]|nr:hypothetical protein [Capnocytophaga sp.]
MEKKEIYFEKQKMIPTWGVILIVIFLICLALGIYRQLFMDIPFGNSPMSNVGLVSFGIIVLIFVYFFVKINLILRIENQAITIHFSPIYKVKILFDDIKQIKIITYSAMGIGIRISVKYGTIYRVGGNKGLFIELKNGNKILIGTKKENELRDVLKGKWRHLFAGTSDK